MPAPHSSLGADRLSAPYPEVAPGGPGERQHQYCDADEAEHYLQADPRAGQVPQQRDFRDDPDDQPAARGQRQPPGRLPLEQQPDEYEQGENPTTTSRMSPGMR